MTFISPRKIKTFKFNSYEDAETMYLMLRETTKWRSVEILEPCTGAWHVVAIEKDKVPSKKLTV